MAPTFWAPSAIDRICQRNPREISPSENHLLSVISKFGPRFNTCHNPPIILTKPTQSSETSLENILCPPINTPTVTDTPSTPNHANVSWSLTQGSTGVLILQLNDPFQLKGCYTTATSSTSQTRTTTITTAAPSGNPSLGVSAGGRSGREGGE